MPFYHLKKDDALAAGAQYAEHFIVRTELEPFNGWVLVLQPRSKDVFNYALAPLLEQVELDLSAFTRLSKRPVSHRKPPPPPPTTTAVKKQEAELAVTATWKPGEALPW